MAVAGLAMAACQAGPPPVTPIPVAGTEAQPREVNIVAKDFVFLPDVLDLVPGETVLLHVVNGGLDVHEAIIGDASVQDAWEIAEAATAGAPPGPTPEVSVPPDVAGLRIVVPSGQRVDVRWTVPAGRPDARPARGSSAATSPVTGRRAWSSPSAGSGRGPSDRPRWYALGPRRSGALTTEPQARSPRRNPGWPT